MCLHQPSRSIAGQPEAVSGAGRRPGLKRVQDSVRHANENADQSAGAFGDSFTPRLSSRITASGAGEEEDQQVDDNKPVDVEEFGCPVGWW